MCFGKFPWQLPHQRRIRPDSLPRSIVSNIHTVPTVSSCSYRTYPQQVGLPSPVAMYAFVLSLPFYLFKISVILYFPMSSPVISGCCSLLVVLQLTNFLIRLINSSLLPSHSSSAQSTRRMSICQRQVSSSRSLLGRFCMH